MASQNGATTKTTRATIKDLLAGRVQAAEKLASQLERWEQAREAEVAAAEKVATEAATAREVYDEAIAAGWTAKELGAAGLKPPAAPRTRSGGSNGSADA